MPKNRPKKADLAAKYSKIGINAVAASVRYQDDPAADRDLAGEPEPQKKSAGSAADRAKPAAHRAKDPGGTD